MAELVKSPPAMQETPGLIPGSRRCPGEGTGYPLQYSWASLVAQLVNNCLQCGRPGFDPWVGKIPLEKGKATHSDMASIPVSGRSPGGEHGNPLQSSCLENPIDKRDSLAMVHRVAKSWTQLK